MLHRHLAIDIVGWCQSEFSLDLLSVFYLGKYCQESCLDEVERKPANTTSMMDPIDPLHLYDGVENGRIQCHMHHALINCALQFTGSIQNTTTHMVRLSFLTLLSNLCLLAKPIIHK